MFEIFPDYFNEVHEWKYVLIYGKLNIFKFIIIFNFWYQCSSNANIKSWMNLSILACNLPWSLMTRCLALNIHSHKFLLSLSTSVASNRPLVKASIMRRKSTTPKIVPGEWLERWGGSQDESSPMIRPVLFHLRLYVHKTSNLVRT